MGQHKKKGLKKVCLVRSNEEKGSEGMETCAIWLLLIHCQVFLRSCLCRSSPFILQRDRRSERSHRVELSWTYSRWTQKVAITN